MPRGGSSPLARGLPRSGSCRASWSRIIPARAGFTTGRTQSAPHPEDHPRSRGVYDHPQTRLLRRDGSSPLARGLLTANQISHVRVKDHPRSRGVYLVILVLSIISSGSSPLARGLQPRRGAPTRGRGIIPARAGFTLLIVLDAPCQRDHPRSRGVYTRAACREALSGGSSPLARGLLSEQRATQRVRGIIPARAGFTPVCCAPSGRGGDHPRSRGVYRCFGWRSTRRSGSSPLARGLPCTVRPIRVVAGIIPARAGFTGWCRGPVLV
ncbi:hypothetical protein HMPREF9062_2123 [Actinomyces sp. oral taxon 448 str. F0400]|nr:hypothetical protein HMPREF9062_2123 [Actinomyces sp. oral taxon 448 str. F0400]